MATVLGGASFAVYTAAKRYIVPLIAPPTPPQLEQDKAAIDGQFDKAFALLDQLASDTQELKKTESDRSEKLDTALGEVEAVMGRLGEATKTRDDEGRRIADELRVLKDMIPKAIESHKDAQDQRLKDLATEMKSLKTLISNRMAAPPSVPSPGPTPLSRPNPTAVTFNPAAVTGMNGASPAAASAAAVPASAAAPPTDAATNQAAEPTKSAVSSVPDRSATSSPYGRMMNGRAAIPAWQMAASKKTQEAKDKSATVEPVTGSVADGASA